jgi:cardiolipin synthase C
LDDDRFIAALDSHPNIEVRLFNPFAIRKPQIGYLIHFFRANRRTHNKSFTADNQVTIIGGRNIGDEYLGAAEGSLFVDLDVMAVDPVVREVSKDFDRYWANDSSYPLDRIVSSIVRRTSQTLKDLAGLRRKSCFISSAKRFRLHRS